MSSPLKKGLSHLIWSRWSLRLLPWISIFTDSNLSSKKDRRNESINIARFHTFGGGSWSWRFQLCSAFDLGGIKDYNDVGRHGSSSRSTDSYRKYCLINGILFHLFICLCFHIYWDRENWIMHFIKFVLFFFFLDLSFSSHFCSYFDTHTCTDTYHLVIYVYVFNHPCTLMFHKNYCLSYNYLKNLYGRFNRVNYTLILSTYEG